MTTWRDDEFSVKLAGTDKLFAKDDEHATMPIFCPRCRRGDHCYGDCDCDCIRNTVTH